MALAAGEPTVKYHPISTSFLTSSREAGRRTVPDGQFDWGGSRLKNNNGVLRFPQAGRQSAVECNGIRELNCESDRTNRCESRA